MLENTNLWCTKLFFPLCISKAFHSSCTFKKPRLILVHFPCTSETPLFALVHLDNLVLVHILEDVGRIQENSDGSEGGDCKEDEELEPVYHHGNVFPVFPYLENVKNNL